MKRTWLSVITFMAVVLASSGDLVQATDYQSETVTSYGYYAGVLGDYNAFFGDRAGYFNWASGDYNSFFGSAAGYSNTMGSYNSFFGVSAGQSNMTGCNNSFFGTSAGASNTTGYDNSFFGYGSGFFNSTGFQNSFFGQSAGMSNLTGDGNTFLGASAGSSNTDANLNTFVGSLAGYSNTTASNNSFFGGGAGYSNTTASNNSFFGGGAGYFNTEGTGNTFFGVTTGISNTVENGNSFIGAYSDGAAGINNATAIGYLAQVTRSNSLVLGGVNGFNGATAETNIGIGITNPDRQLTVEGTQAVGRLRRYYGSTDPFTRTYAPTFLLERSRGTQAAPANIQAGDYLGKVQFRGVVGGSAIEYGAMAFIATDTGQNGRFAFIDRDLTTERVSILNTGNVGIGTTAPLQRLHVVGNVQIDGDLLWSDAGASMPDYVFEPGYRLMPIDQLENFIAEEKHLPNIPAASQVKDQGLNVTEFQMKLLEKIEELTLYTVQQAKTIALKDAEIAALRSQNLDQDARLAVLEQMMGQLSKQER